MPTLEERLEALERALSTIRAEQISDIRQLDERISALHQQVAEQRRRLSERDQDLQQKFDSSVLRYLEDQGINCIPGVL